MEKYELLLIILIICLLRVNFNVVIKELDVFKFFRLKHAKITINPSRIQISRIYNTVKYYNNYELPYVIVSDNDSL